MLDAATDLQTAGERLIVSMRALPADVYETMAITDNGQRLPCWMEGEGTPAAEWVAEKLAGVFDHLEMLHAEFRQNLAKHRNAIRHKVAHRPICVVNNRPFASAGEALDWLAGEVYWDGIATPFLVLLRELSEALPTGMLSANDVAFLLVRSDHPHREVFRLLDTLENESVSTTFWSGVLKAVTHVVEPVESLAVEFHRECALIDESGNTPGRGRNEGGDKPGRKPDPFTKPRAEHANQHVAAGGLGWEEATKLYQAENPDDTDVTVRKYRGAYERRFLPK